MLRHGIEMYIERGQVSFSTDHMFPDSDAEHSSGFFLSATHPSNVFDVMVMVRDHDLGVLPLCFKSTNFSPTEQVAVAGSPLS